MVLLVDDQPHILRAESDVAAGNLLALERVDFPKVRVRHAGDGLKLNGSVRLLDWLHGFEFRVHGAARSGIMHLHLERIHVVVPVLVEPETGRERSRGVADGPAYIGGKVANVEDRQRGVVQILLIGRAVDESHRDRR